MFGQIESLKVRLLVSRQNITKNNSNQNFTSFHFMHHPNQNVSCRLNLDLIEIYDCDLLLIAL
jgi:hypothetical protein